MEIDIYANQHLDFETQRIVLIVENVGKSALNPRFGDIYM